MESISNRTKTGLDQIINENTAPADKSRPEMQNRRDFMKMLAAGLGSIAQSFYSGNAEAFDDRPKSLIGTPSSLAKQVAMFEKDGLQILYDKDLKEASELRKKRELVLLDRITPYYYMNGIEAGNEVARPYVKLFLLRLSEQSYRACKDKLKVAGLTRSYEYQIFLNEVMKNHNATSPKKSPHVRGTALDISYLEMSPGQKQWMRENLVKLERANYIEATEELVQKTFHIMVFKSYINGVQRKLRLNDADFARYYEHVTGGKYA